MLHSTEGDFTENFNISVIKVWCKITHLRIPRYLSGDNQFKSTSKNKYSTLVLSEQGYNYNYTETT